MSANNLQIVPNALAPEMPKDLYEKAIELFSIPSTSYNEKSMGMYIVDELKEIENVDYYIDDYGNIIVVKGDSDLYPCFCAHLDTVHIYPDGFRLMSQKEKNRTYLFAADKSKKSVGIGGDDKCGIFVCLYLLKRLDHVKIIFFSQEESGGTGSANINTEVFSNCQFLGGIDRWNGHDFINKYSGEHTISKAFKKAVMPYLDHYGYYTSSGLFTDSFNVMERSINLSCFNLSCGYYSHHSSSEYVDLNELYNACLLCEDLSINLFDKYPHKYKGYGSYTSKWSDAWDYGFKGWNKDKDGTWRQGRAATTYDAYNKAYDKYDQKLDKYSKMPETEDEFVNNALPRCEVCNLELLYNERKYCSSCAEMLKRDREIQDIYENYGD